MKFVFKEVTLTYHVAIYGSRVISMGKLQWLSNTNPGIVTWFDPSMEGQRKFIALRIYKYHVVGHYPSCCLFFKTQRVGGWTLPLSSGSPYLRSGPEIGTSSIDWAQLSRFYLKTETESSLRNVVFLHKGRTMDNGQQHNICTNAPSEQTFRSYLRNITYRMSFHNTLLSNFQIQDANIRDL
jgi:hypothetical protein